MVHSRDEGSGTAAGLAVVAIFLSLSEGEENDELNELLDEVDEIKEYEGQVCKQFFSYCGRLYPHTRRREHDDQDDSKRKKRQASFSQFHPKFRDQCEKNRFREMDKLTRWRPWFKQKTVKAYADWYDRGLCFPHDEECPHHGNTDGRSKCGGVDLEISPEKLLPRPRHYYYYYGSLTTPTLSEAVLWQVMMQPIRITREQLEKLQVLESRAPGTLHSTFGNLRPWQNQNGRRVFANICEQLKR